MPLESLRKLAGRVTNKDLLQGIAAGAMHVASHGGVSNEEADQIMVSLSSNAAIKDNFSPDDVRAIVSDYRQKVQESPRMAKLAFKKEVEDCANKPEWGRTIVAIALDVGDRGGGLDADEEVRAREVCAWAKVEPREFDL